MAGESGRLTRREAALALTTGVLALGAAPPANPFEELERRAGGRLGVCLYEPFSGTLSGCRLDERFALCSTFKLPLATMILKEAEEKRVRLSDRVRISKADLAPYAPVVEKHLGRGWMTVKALAEAAQTVSDNAAANLLLRKIGGPEGFTRRLRVIGDDETRLDRFETALNLVPAGELRDTTTPRAMAATLSTMLTGNYLTPKSRALLFGWMVATKSGARRIRAGLPADWRAGDKTGTAQADGMNDKINDIALVWPAHGRPFIVTAYYEGPSRSQNTRPGDEAVLAEAGRIAARMITA